MYKYRKGTACPKVSGSQSVKNTRKTGASMGGYRHILLIGSSLLALAGAGCMNGAGTQGDVAGEATALSQRPARGEVVENDIEAPEVFRITDEGLWDGRPSLGGIWVAYPDVADPERVIIRNESNGKFVIGALFRRERENPGPKLQTSSDAAAALGMLAGAPVMLSVTALRREEPAAESAPKAEEPAPAAGGKDVAVSGDDAAPPPAATEAEPARAKRSWNPFRRRNAAPAAPAAEEVSTEPLPAATRAIADEPAGVPEARETGSKLDKPYVQIGIFSVEANADATAAALRENGLAARIYEQQSSGKTFWRVVAGPSATRVDRAALLGKVKAMGFGDAYPVSG